MNFRERTLQPKQNVALQEHQKGDNEKNHIHSEPKM